MLRSVAAVLAGFLYVVASLMAVGILLSLCFPDVSLMPGDEELPTPPWMLPLIVLLSAPCGLLGGYAAAYIAGAAERAHGLVVGLLVLIFLSLSTFVAHADVVPLWYQVGFPLTGALAAALGGTVRALQKRHRQESHSSPRGSH